MQEEENDKTGSIQHWSFRLQFLNSDYFRRTNKVGETTAAFG